jgi:hypothetical protein
MRRKLDWPLTISWALTASVLLATGITVFAYPGQEIQYDPIVLLNGLTVVGLIWAAYFARAAYIKESAALAYQIDRDQTERAKRRRNLATAAIFEIETIEQALNDPHATTLAEHAALDKVLDSAEIFDTQTIAELVVAFRRLTERDRPTSEGTRLKAAEQLRILKDRMQVEGRPLPPERLWTPDP